MWESVEKKFEQSGGSIIREIYKFIKIEATCSDKCDIIIKERLSFIVLAGWRHILWPLNKKLLVLNNITTKPRNWNLY